LKPLVRFETLGCRLNSVESEAAARFFLDAGFEVSYGQSAAGSQPPENAALAVINTCTVTSKAEQKCRRAIRLALAECPRAVVLVTGCYAEMDAEKLAALGPRVAVLRGSQKELLADIPALIKNFFDSRPDALALADALKTLFSRGAPESFKLAADTFIAHSRPSLKIQDGCDNECSFCRIRLARGKSRSLPAEEVVERARQLERAGYREAVLAGVNLFQYKSAFEGRETGFSELIPLILQNTSSIAVRLSSLYPEHIDDALCAVLSDPRVRPHFHLSVQAGSDSVLRRMNRPYTRDAVIRAVKLLRCAKGNVFGNPFIACDIIAGFPGETDGDFELTRALCADCGFAWIHVFPFSPRPGTPAYSMKDALPQRVISERAAALSRLAETQKIAYIESCAGKTVRAVIEKDSRAVTENFLHIALGRGCRRADSDAQAADVDAARRRGGAPPLCLRPGEETTVRILGPLEESIRSGGEADAEAELC
jgi:threonylcarbamoyladenosine tRNA methylthiotransferase MtaB